MECGYSNLVDVFKKASKEIEKIVNSVLHFLSTYTKYKIDKENYKFLKEIKPNKITLSNKRFNTYHCRNSC